LKEAANWPDGFFVPADERLLQTTLFARGFNCHGKPFAASLLLGHRDRRSPSLPSGSGRPASSICPDLIYDRHRHAGIGSVSYIGCLLLNSAIGIKPTLVPFTGTAPVMNAILAGNVDYDCDPVLGPLQHVRAGTVKALAIAAKKRSPLLPDVPTSYEQGFPQFDSAPFYAVFAPKGTPQPVIEKLPQR
jgi:hypothetical protein